MAAFHSHSTKPMAEATYPTHQPTTQLPAQYTQALSQIASHPAHVATSDTPPIDLSRHNSQDQFFANEYTNHHATEQLVPPPDHNQRQSLQHTEQTKSLAESPDEPFHTN